MIVSDRGNLRRAARSHWCAVALVPLYTTAVVVLYQTHVIPVAITLSIPAMLGTALSILLGFRTSAAYERWWEARKIWGAIVNDSRTFARQVLSLLATRDPGEQAAMTALQRELVHRQIAWNYVLARSLRGEEPLVDVDDLDSEELAVIGTQDNPANALLQVQALRLRRALERGWVDTFTFLQIETGLTRFCDHMGKCERIKSTVFPALYSELVERMMWLFSILLPFGFVDSLGWLTIPVASTTALLFWLIEPKSAALQDPFEGMPTDTAMLAISRGIEINLREQLGETQTPPRLEAVGGVLM